LFPIESSTCLDHSTTRFCQPVFLVSLRETLTYIDLSIDHSRIGGIDGGKRVRADVILGRENRSYRQSSGFDISLGDALKYSIGCPVVPKSLQIEGIVEPALSTKL
jgi:hypothetical protein